MIDADTLRQMIESGLVAVMIYTTITTVRRRQSDGIESEIRERQHRSDPRPDDWRRIALDLMTDRPPSNAPRPCPRCAERDRVKTQGQARGNASQASVTGRQMVRRLDQASEAIQAARAAIRRS